MAKPIELCTRGEFKQTSLKSHRLEFFTGVPRPVKKNQGSPVYGQFFKKI